MVQTVIQMSGVILTTLLMVFIIRPAASTLRLVDHPDNDRKLHVGSVPLTGGISLLIALYAVFVAADLVAVPLTEAPNFWLIVGAALVALVIVHAIDDVIGMRATTRLITDALLALLLCVYAGIELKNLGNLIGIGTIGLGHYSALMTVFCFVAASNAFNMVDGIDSLCTGLGIICFTTLGALILLGDTPLASTMITPLLVVLAALLPLYVANLGLLGPGFRVFLGDAGARLIGFIAAIALILAARNDLIKPVMAFFPIAVPVCDCLVLMGLRMLHGRSPVSADRLHLHHLLQDLGYSPGQTRRLILSLATGFSVCGIAFQLTGPTEWMVSLFVVVSFWAFIAFRFWLMRLHTARQARPEDIEDSGSGTAR